MTRPEGQGSSLEKVRLDKWLWAARFFKTRQLAKEAIEGGKVHYNNARSKPSRIVEVGGMLVIKMGWSEKTIRIINISDKRGPAKTAQLLYEETPDSIKNREQLSWERKQIMAAQMPPPRRPTKKQRRLIHRFKNRANEEDK